VREVPVDAAQVEKQSLLEVVDELVRAFCFLVTVIVLESTHALKVLKYKPFILGVETRCFFKNCGLLVKYSAEGPTRLLLQLG
jgi:hypothetical protein